MDVALSATRTALEHISAETYASSMCEVRTIGSGSFGSAMLVEMVDTHEQFVAKKIALEHLTEEDKQKARNEAHLLRSLHHPNITEYFGSFDTAGTLHIIMEYCSGGSLQQVMSRRERSGETFDTEEVYDWFLQIALALSHVHRHKILHRDIKVRPRDSGVCMSTPVPHTRAHLFAGVQRLPDEAQHR